MRVLVVEDEEPIASAIERGLIKIGYAVDVAYDGVEALDKAGVNNYDVICLDLNLPRMDGLDVCRTIRRESDIPVIMLTARVEEQDRLIGLELGADDYIVKPFSPREVVARVRAVLRRAQPAPSAPETVTAADVELDLVRHAATVAGEAVELTPTEFELLRAMAAEPGRAFSRMELLDATQGEAYEGYERTIDTHVKNLRNKIEPDPKSPRYIITVYGVGYKFAED